MYRLVCSSLALVGLLLVSAPAQEFKKDEKKDETKQVDPAKKTTPNGGTGTKVAQEPVAGDVEVVFLNGSKVRMMIQTDALEIVTIYGKLSVPIQDVQSIEFGLHFPDGVADKIDAAIKNLGGSDYREREKASKVLIDLGQYSYAAVLKAARTKETLEVSKRAKEIVQKLQEKLPKKDLKTSVEDKVVTPTHTIVGRILTAAVKTKAEYFGDIEHKIANMRTLRAVGSASTEVELAVDSSKYANQGQWMETTFQVDSRYGLVITAKGQVDQWPQQPGGYMCGPGGTRGGRFNPNGLMLVPGGQKAIGPINGQTYAGMLLGKVGVDGEPFIIADRYEGKLETEGKLFLHIGPSPWNCPSAGSYEVKITRKSD